MRLEQACSTLDVGCGLGDDVADMARCLPPGGGAERLSIEFFRMMFGNHVSLFFLVTAIRR